MEDDMTQKLGWFICICGSNYICRNCKDNGFTFCEDELDTDNGEYGKPNDWEVYQMAPSDARNKKLNGIKKYLRLKRKRQREKEQLKIAKQYTTRKRRK